MDSEILDQLTSLEQNVNSEVTKPKGGRRKKADPKVNEVEDSLTSYTTSWTTNFNKLIANIN